MKNLIFYGILLMSLFSCIFEGETHKLVDGFEIGYSNSIEYMNIFYRSEGVLNRDYTLNASWNSEKYILVRTLTRTNGHIPSNADTSYFLINIQEYKDNYGNSTRVKSNPGLIGPLTMQRMIFVSDSVGLGHIKFEVR